MSRGHYYSGTSGLLLPVPNKHFFPDEYKDKSRLAFYGSILNSIEINSSFYKVPMASTVQRWYTEVPDGFRFTFKLNKEITHNKGLAFDPAAVARFMEIISAVGPKKGALLVQFPASITIHAIKQVRLLMDNLRNCDPERAWDIALEFRHRSFYQPEIYSLLDEYGMALVIQDMPRAATPLRETALPFVYLRFHGPEGDYKGSYTPQLMQEYAVYIKEWLTEGKTVYTYFNNTIGDALPNLHTLRELLGPLAGK